MEMIKKNNSKFEGKISHTFIILHVFNYMIELMTFKANVLSRIIQNERNNENFLIFKKIQKK